MNIEKSKELFLVAEKVIPGGVNSPVRAFKSVGCSPLFIKESKGSKIIDVDGNEYIDYVGSWGPMIVGNAHPKVQERVIKALEKGSSFGAPTEMEIELAQKIIDIVPSVEMVRMVNSGTEATMSAIRLARGVTGRDKIIKFNGCYHGHADYLLASAGSGLATLSIPGTPGVTAKNVSDTLIAELNNRESVEALFNQHGKDIAALIIEPVVGNAGCIPPVDGFLEFLREITEKNGTIFIFDEVMTGFRVSQGGAQTYYNIKPDLSCFGKVIGGGLPVGAYGGKKEIMENIAPVGNVYQAGTLSGNPLAMAAGIATLEILAEEGAYTKLEENSKKLCEGVLKQFNNAGYNFTGTRVGSMFSVFFTEEKVTDFTSALTSDTKKFSRYFQNMLENKVYIAPSQFEAGFLSLAHSDEDIEKTIEAVSNSLKGI
ncbi:MAG: glutamate-1-semialdehyde 2,1-aminomutase [Nitrospinae bacterium]|nr:glutamate-1-semialdehyde 2,1-aminomutase [Nitrospinota bacterium]